MATVKFSSTIGRPAEDVFDLVANVGRNPEWCPGFTGAERLTAGPIGRGTAFRTAMRGMGDLEIRITEYERPRRLWFVGAASAVEIGHGFVFTPDGAGTRVDQRIDVRPKGLLRLAAPLMALTLKRRILTNTAALKAYLEHGATGRQPSRGTHGPGAAARSAI